MNQPVTVIGLGNMGSALAAAFLAAGHPTTVHNRTPGKADGLVAAGAVEAGSVAEAVTASRLVVVCVLDYPATRAALEPAATLLAGRAIVSLNTGNTAGARDIAAWVTRQGADYLDGAIMAIPDAIGAEDTLLVYSGDRPVFDTHAATLRALGGRADFVGTDPGLAVLFEAAIGATLVPALWGFLQGAAMLRTVDIPAETLLPYAKHWLDTVVAPVLPVVAAEADDRDYDTGMASLDLFSTGLGHELEQLAELGLDTEVTAAFKRLIDRAAAGHGGHSITRMIEAMPGPAARL